MRAIGWWNRPQYHIVDVSAPLRAEQQKRLGRKAVWHKDVGDALAVCGGSALIFSNELVDAFPCRIFQKHSGSWRELALRIEGGKVLEVWLEPDPANPARPKSSAFEHDWPDGQRIETQESHSAWQEKWLPSWKAGAMLTIDYGDTCPELYHRRPFGTLRAYAHHQRLEGREAYAGFGLRDLTVDVNFSDLQQLSGLTVEKQLRLDQFIKEYGQVKDIPATFEQAGEAFQALMHMRSSG